MTDKVVIAVYLVAMSAAGYIGMRRSRSGTDFTVAGRRLGPFMYTSAMSTVILGGTATVGGVSLGYQYGISGMALVLMFAAGIAVIGLLFAGKLFRAGVRTVPEALERRYGSTARVLGAVIVVAYTVLVGVTQIVAMRTVLEVVFDIPTWLAASIGWVVVVVYSVAGGMWSITLTDVVQFTIKTIGIFFILLPLAVFHAGGFDGMRDALPSSYFSPTGIGVGTIGAYFLLFFFGFMMDQGNWQRLATARSVSVAKWGAVASGVYCALYGAAGALIGTAAKALLPKLESADNAYASIATHLLPAGILGIVMAAAIAATMSTASGLLIGSSTVLTQDVLRPVWGDRMNGVRANRLALAASCLVALVLAQGVHSIVGIVTVAADLLAAALFVPTIGAMFVRRSGTAAAVASIVAGAVACVVFMVVSGLYANEPVMYGMLASLVAFVVASFVTRGRPPVDFEDLAPTVTEDTTCRVTL